MNRKLVLKNIDVLTDWLRRGTAWKRCLPVGEWKKIDASYNWATELCPNLYFVIDDEYVDLRKDLVDGMAILVKKDGEWIEDSNPDFSLPVDSYTSIIKKEDTDFKLDEWVFLSSSARKPIKVKESHLRDWDLYGLGTACRWTPADGEYCWFTDKQVFFIVRIKNVNYGFFEGTNCSNNKPVSGPITFLEPYRKEASINALLN